MYSGFIPVKPQPKQSMRIGQGRGFPDPKKAAYQRELARHIPEVAVKLSQKVQLNVIFISKGRQSDLHQGRADVDNLMKPLQDALQGKLMQNDSQIVIGREAKLCHPTIEGIYWEVAAVFPFSDGIKQFFANLEKVLPNGSH